ncbi:MAG: DUF87 domain-containing protein [Candidatus Micrarchaeota archaeon]|nr:DUF87 domain-containing protein [Candidatus Micrarchaeota archaeon]
MTLLSNSKVASSSLCLSAMSECSPRSGTGIYIGRTSVYKMPFILDTDEMMNPHISVIGTSGSGKTYLLKAIIARSAIHLGANVLMLDWTGEYSKLVEHLGGVEFGVGAGFDADSIDINDMLDGIASLNLSRLRQDGQKAAVTKHIVEAISRRMHNYGIGSKKTHMIVLDEAWRLISESNELGALFREGRKYGFGVVLATQLVSDIKNEVIANSATVAIFKLQNSDDVSTLVSSGVICQDDTLTIGALGQGSCMLHLSFKDSGALKRNVIIDKVDGVELGFYEFRGNGMRVQDRKFRGETEKLHLGEDAKAKLYSFVDASDRHVDEAGLISLLIKLGVKRPMIVTYMRSLGLDDFSIVAAYEAAASEGKQD